MAPTPERPKKRDLIRWDEDKDAMILIAIHAHCSKRGIKIPWDDIGREVGPTVTGNAVVQHIAKIKKKREELGKAVPEISIKRKRGEKFPSDASDDDIEDGKSDDSYKASKRKVAKRNITKPSRAGTGNKRSKRANQTNIDSKKPEDVPIPSIEHGDETSSASIEPRSDDESRDNEHYLAGGESWMKFDKFRPDTPSQASAAGVPKRKSTPSSTPKKQDMLVKLPLKGQASIDKGEDDNGDKDTETSKLKKMGMLGYEAAKAHEKVVSHRDVIAERMRGKTLDYHPYGYFSGSAQLSVPPMSYGQPTGFAPWQQDFHSGPMPLMSFNGGAIPTVPVGQPGYPGVQESMSSSLPYHGAQWSPGSTNHQSQTGGSGYGHRSTGLTETIPPSQPSQQDTGHEQQEGEDESFFNTGLLGNLDDYFNF